jgi:hypothetical protein
LKKNLPLLLTILSLFLYSCGESLSPVETVKNILYSVDRDDFEALKETAPLLYALDGEQRRDIRETLAPYTPGNGTVTEQERRIGFRTLFVTPAKGEGKTLVISLRKRKGSWVLQDKITFSQSFAFIPLKD